MKENELLQQAKKDLSLTGKILYYSGALKYIKNESHNYLDHYLRLWHPITYIGLIYFFIVSTFLQGAIETWVEFKAMRFTWK